METKALTLAEAIKEPETVNDFMMALGTKEKAEAFLSSLVTMACGDPKLQKCNPKSVLNAAHEVASKNLPLGMNFAAIIPYGDDAQFQIMTEGYIQLALRSGQLSILNAFEIYADEYNGMDKIKGELRPLKDHSPSCTEIVGYGAYLELINGFSKLVYWTKEQVTAHAKKFSKSFSSGPWATNFEAMAKKTMIKQVLKFAPKDIGIYSAIQNDQKVYRADGTSGYDDNPNVVDVFTEEEMKEREALLTDLQNIYGISAEQLCAARKVNHINEVPTTYLVAVFNKKEKQMNANKEEN